MDYKKTLNLPKTDFPMRANLPTKEKEILKKWNEGEGVYKKIISKRKENKPFILHDGPPYANGTIHLGHALNKSLKDFVVKYKSLKGFYTPYIPGWDCHGMPIEHEVSKTITEEITVDKFRKKCRNFALKFVEKQKKDFERLGVFGDWEHPYLTLQPEYEAGILSIFKKMVLDGYVFRQRKPVYWCPSCHTALAEAEVEYHDHTSPTVYVKFEDKNEKNSYFVIWTTTPWTLPANVAIALHPDFDYVKVKVGDEFWIVGEPLWDAMRNEVGVEDFEIVEKYKGKELEGRVCQHPFIDERESKVVLADYVTDDAGTGCVHTAPGHGQEDYLTGLKYGLPILNPVDDEGRFTDEFALMKGEYVFDANSKIIELLKEKNALIYTNKIVHSYPHCWRCKTPLIFRATEQWFIDINHNDLRKEALKQIKDTEWIPAWGENRITSMVSDRPEWCVSRQRTWGVPITMFYCEDCKEYVIDEKIFDRVIDFIKENGTDGWFTHTEEEILGDLYKCPKCGGTHLKKDMNIFDVWFESGGSYKSVMETREELEPKADLYLEGSDQHRGWFQSTLLMSTAERGEAPFTTVLTHGYVVDGKGRKMSKSAGNGIAPQDIIKQYGADIVRLWVASEDYKNDVTISDEIIKRVVDAYRRIRNTFRFMLGTLFDFDPEKDSVSIEKMPEYDRFMMYELKKFLNRMETAYDNYEFHKIYHGIHNYCVVNLSALYLDGAKSLLYAEEKNDLKRRAIQTVVWNTILNLTKIISPILSFTAEEVWGHLKTISPSLEESVHLSDWPELNYEIDESFYEKWQKLLALRDMVKKVLEDKRQKGEIGHSLDAYVYFYSENNEIADFIKAHLEDFRRANIVSGVYFEKIDDMIKFDEEELLIGAIKSPHKKCERCWEYSKTVGEDSEYPDLCVRCATVLKKNKG